MSAGLAAAMLLVNSRVSFDEAIGLRGRHLTTQALSHVLKRLQSNPCWNDIRRAIIALAAGVIVALIGLLVPPLRWLYDYAWFVGFGTAAVVYVARMSRAAPESEPTAPVFQSIEATEGEQP